MILFCLPSLEDRRVATTPSVERTAGADASRLLSKENAMTTAHVEKFAELVAKDPALLAKLGLDKVNADAETASASAAAASASAAAFITNAVKEAKALGLEFTEEEATAYMEAENKAAAEGELSNSQLEAVAGGKGAPSWMRTAFNFVLSHHPAANLYRKIGVPIPKNI